MASRSNSSNGRFRYSPRTQRKWRGTFAGVFPSCGTSPRKTSLTMTSCLRNACPTSCFGTRSSLSPSRWTPISKPSGVRAQIVVQPSRLPNPRSPRSTPACPPVNKLRAMVRTAFNRARRADLVHGQNPASDTKPRKVPKRTPAFLEPHEVPRLLAELSGEDRPLVATALYAGLRKGELFGLQKRDVDLKRRLLTVRRSYGNETNKSAREEAVPIAAALVPFLEEALDASKGALLFPRPDGEMRTEEDKLGKRLRRALGRAGIVDGYLHSCRRCKRHGAPHEEKHPDCDRRLVPAMRHAPLGQAVTETLPPARHAAHDSHPPRFGRRRSVRGRAHPSAHRSQDHLR